MDSGSHRREQEQKRKEQIEAKISSLQAELGDLPRDVKRPSSPKRKREVPKTLVPETPSPKKKRKLDIPQDRRPIPQPTFKRAPVLPPPPKPSNVLSNLANIKSDATELEPTSQIHRTTAFSDAAVADQELTSNQSKRDDNLALIHQFEPGPYNHTPPSDDPLFDKLEPHSKIALKSRTLSHEDFSAHLEGRYYLSPSQLYSCIRLQPDKQHYDVPVPGDWVTIAVVAERGPIKYTRAPVALEGDGAPTSKWQSNKGKKPEEKPSGKKYTNIKLIDFGARSTSSATGSKPVVRGDAFLSLLLFEAESVEVIENPNGKGRPTKVYKGGSNGAFESLEKLKEGDVIALLNPRILKPYQKSSDTPHPTTNILAVTPPSPSSIALLGRARDLGMCTVRKKDNSICGSWVDKRASSTPTATSVCEYHLLNAVTARRAARPEFTASTGGMSNSSIVQRKSDAYDPRRQWGLKPDAAGGSGATYVISGHVVRPSASANYNPENIGREGQAKARRKLAGDEEKQLKKMLERDRDGMKAVLLAREAVGAAATAVASGSGSGSGSKGASKTKGKGKEKDRQMLVGEDTAVAELNKPKKAYSQNVIRSLGFDPTLRPGHRRGEITDDSKDKREKLEALCSSKRQIKLGSAPGPKKRSNIVAPPSIPGTTNLTDAGQDGGVTDDDGHAEEATREDGGQTPEPPASEPPDDGMIDLDDF